MSRIPLYFLYMKNLRHFSEIYSNLHAVNLYYTIQPCIIKNFQFHKLISILISQHNFTPISLLF